MKLTTKSEYSLLSMIYLARHGKEEFVKTEKIASKYDLPQGYLEQLFYILKSSRYIKTKRGKSGGYQLAKQPREITIAEIVRLMDGPLAPVESVSKYFFSHTKIEKEKKLIETFRQIRNYVAEKLENLTLEDFI